MALNYSRSEGRVASPSASKLTRAATSSAPGAVASATLSRIISSAASRTASCASAVQPEGRAARRRHPSGQVVRRVAGRADNQDFSRSGNALDEGADGAEPVGGRGRLERL